jgi:hypothetical protein
MLSGLISVISVYLEKIFVNDVFVNFDYVFDFRSTFLIIVIYFVRTRVLFNVLFLSLINKNRNRNLNLKKLKILIFNYLKIRNVRVLLNLIIIIIRCELIFIILILITRRILSLALQFRRY